MMNVKKNWKNEGIELSKSFPISNNHNMDKPLVNEGGL